MTDKEMAKEYVDTLLNKDDSELDKFLDENLGDLKLTKKQAGTLLGIIKGIGISSFLAGLKAGKPKWHDLRKDPNDLPKVNQKVLLQIKDEGRPIIDFYTRYGVWNFTNEYEAIAWCEIPKYTGE